MTNYDLIEVTDIASKAMGGTELITQRIYDGKVPRELLEQFQIIPTRVRELNKDKYRILHVHDLAEDPEIQHLANEGWRKFHKIVFVSNWQAQRVIERFNIPWSKTVVMTNAIEPLERIDSASNDKIEIVYHTTPHRGLNILLPVFDHLCKTYDNLHLNLFSSFKLYGWEDRDKEFETSFKFADEHPKITNWGTQPQEKLRNILSHCHIFAYPSIWPETSCLCLMEAMSAGLLCVHSNFGALPETAANWTTMYGYHEDLNEHAKIFYSILDQMIPILLNENTQMRLKAQKTYVDAFYNWNVRARQWEALLRSILETNEARGIPSDQFVYRF